MQSGGAIFSEDRRYRYALWRVWASAPDLAVVGLNPSVADGARDDPTVRRCIAFARRWGFGGLRLVNLFAFRATDPRALWSVADPAGPESWRHSLGVCAETANSGGALLFAWGRQGQMRGASSEFLALLGAKCGAARLGLTGNGEPRHPLFAAGVTIPEVHIGDGGRLVTAWDADTGRCRLGVGG